MPARRVSSNPAEHGFSEILYAFSSAGNNNGSAFAGLSREHAVLQHRARHLHALRALLAGGIRCSRSPAPLAAAKSVPASSGTLPTHTLLFVVVLIGTVITVGALTFVPALALGPVVEHLLLFAGP